MDHQPNIGHGEAMQYTSNRIGREPIYLLRDEMVMVVIISLNLMQLLQLISSYVHLNLVFTLTYLLIQEDPRRFHTPFKPQHIINEEGLCCCS